MRLALSCAFLILLLPRPAAAQTEVDFPPPSLRIGEFRADFHVRFHVDFRALDSDEEVAPDDVLFRRARVALEGRIYDDLEYELDADVRDEKRPWRDVFLTTLQSGTPINVTIGNDQANIGISGVQRPNLTGGVPSLNCVPNPASPPQLMNCFDAAAFALPAQFTFGNAPRNVLRGPKSLISDLSLMKNVLLGGGATFQIRVEMFNVFNTVNWGNPNAVFNSANFGRITSAGSMRQVQIGGKLLF